MHISYISLSLYIYIERERDVCVSQCGSLSVWLSGSLALSLCLSFCPSVISLSLSLSLWVDRNGENVHHSGDCKRTLREPVVQSAHPRIKRLRRARDQGGARQDQAVRANGSGIERHGERPTVPTFQAHHSGRSRLDDTRCPSGPPSDDGDLLEDHTLLSHL